jgi:hypothetical protein
MSRGLSPNEYNALLHAQWMIERKILELVDSGLGVEDIAVSKLIRDAKALGDLFVRLA